MGHTFYLRRLKEILKIRSRMTRPRSLFDNENMPDNIRTKRWKLKQEVEKFMKSGDLGRAEKRLRKMLRMRSYDHYALSKLITMYSEQGRFEDGEETYESFEKRSICAPSVYTSAIMLYHRAGKLDKAREVFDTAVATGSADHATYSTMLNIYIDLGMCSEAKAVFDLACKNNVLSVSIFEDMSDAYFRKGRFREAKKLIENSPRAVKSSPVMKLRLFEIQRRLKEYDDAIEGVDAFLSGRSVDFDDNTYVHARTIRAYCIMHSRKGLEALEEFAILKENVKQDTVHYPRILCGFIFSKPTLTEAEREHLLADLDFFEVATGKSMHDKIKNAAKLIDRSS